MSYLLLIHMLLLFQDYMQVLLLILYLQFL